MSFVDYTGGVTPTMDLSAQDQNIFNPSTYGNPGGLTVGALLNAAPNISGSSLTLPGITTPANIGNPAGDVVPQATDPITGANPTTTTGQGTAGLAPSACTWTFFGLCLTRIFVVLLGIIFVAVGLSMFGKQAGVMPRVPVIPE